MCINHFCHRNLQSIAPVISGLQEQCKPPADSSSRSLPIPRYRILVGELKKVSMNCESIDQCTHVEIYKSICCSGRWDIIYRFLLMIDTTVGTESYTAALVSKVTAAPGKKNPRMLSGGKPVCTWRGLICTNLFIPCFIHQLSYSILDLRLMSNGPGVVLHQQICYTCSVFFHKTLFSGTLCLMH